MFILTPKGQAARENVSEALENVKAAVDTAEIVLEAADDSELSKLEVSQLA